MDPASYNRHNRRMKGDGKQPCSRCEVHGHQCLHLSRHPIEEHISYDEVSYAQRYIKLLIGLKNVVLLRLVQYVLHTTGYNLDDLRATQPSWCPPSISHRATTKFSKQENINVLVFWIRDLPPSWLLKLFQDIIDTREQERFAQTQQVLIAASYIGKVVVQKIPPNLTGCISQYADYLSSTRAIEHRKHLLEHIARDNLPRWAIGGLAALCPLFRPHSFDAVKNGDNILVWIHSLHKLEMTYESYAVLLRLVVPTILPYFPDAIKHYLLQQFSMLQVKKSTANFQQALSLAVVNLQQRVRVLRNSGQTQINLSRTLEKLPDLAKSQPIEKSCATLLQVYNRLEMLSAQNNANTGSKR